MDASSISREGRDLAETAREHPVLDVIARSGYVVLGLLHLLVGWLAIRIATGSGSGEASNSGALAQIAEAPGGRVALWLAVAGLGALSLWRLLQVAVGPELKHRVKGAALGVVYLSLAATTATFAGGASTSDGEKASDVTATVLNQPAGAVAVGIGGLVIVGVGLYSIYQGISRKFVENLERGAESGNVGTAIVATGVVGYIARGVAFAVLGGLVVWAALTNDPEKAGGLDAALRYIGEQPFGMVLLIVVGVGLMMYGLFCLARARYADADS